MKIKKIYKENWIFLKKSKNFIFLAVGIFLVVASIGFFLPIFFHDTILNIIQKLISRFEGKTLLETIGLIFLNNLWTSFIAIIFGLFFGVAPLIIAISNGYILGFISNIAVKKQGFISLWRLFPHGIFELPAVLLSIGIGLKLGFLVIKNKDKLKNEIVRSLIFFLTIIMPLLMIAAIIEAILIFSF